MSKASIREFSFWVKNFSGELIGDEYVVEAKSLSAAYKSFFSQVLKSGCEFPAEIRIEAEEIHYQHMGGCAQDCPCHNKGFEEDRDEEGEGPEEDLEEVV